MNVMPSYMRAILISLLALVIFAATLSITSNRTYACSCVTPESNTDAIEKASYVFDGTVKKIKHSRNEKSEITFQVHGAWKGEVSEQFIVYSHSEGDTCGYPFAKANRYIVYAFEHEGSVDTGLCTNTTVINRAIYEELGEPPITPVANLAIKEPEHRDDFYSPDEIASRATEQSLQTELNKHQNKWMMIYIIIAALPIVGVIIILLWRKWRTKK